MDIKNLNEELTKIIEAVNHTENTIFSILKETSKKGYKNYILDEKGKRYSDIEELNIKDTTELDVGEYDTEKNLLEFGILDKNSFFEKVFYLDLNIEVDGRILKDYLMVTYTNEPLGIDIMIVYSKGEKHSDMSITDVIKGLSNAGFKDFVYVRDSNTDEDKLCTTLEEVDEYTKGSVDYNWGNYDYDDTSIEIGEYKYEGDYVEFVNFVHGLGSVSEYGYTEIEGNVYLLIDRKYNGRTVGGYILEHYYGCDLSDYISDYIYD